MIFRFSYATILLAFFLSCKPSTEDEFDELKRTSSVFRLAIFCYENPSLQATRNSECESALASSIENIEIILHRQTVLIFTKVILPKQTREEIEQLLRTRTELGIRYLEIWKQSVNLE